MPSSTVMVIASCLTADVFKFPSSVLVPVTFVVIGIAALFASTALVTIVFKLDKFDPAVKS